MKKIILLSLFVSLFISCKNNKETQTIVVPKETISVQDTQTSNVNYATSEFTIDGMQCEIGCAKKIEKNLSKMEGVKSVKVDFETKKARVEYDEAKVTYASLTSNITNGDDVYKVGDFKKVELVLDAKCDKDCKEACKDGEKCECKDCCKDCKKKCEESCKGKSKKECKEGKKECKKDCKKKDCEKCKKCDKKA